MIKALKMMSICMALIPGVIMCQVTSTYRTQGMTTPLYCMDSVTLDIDNDGDLDIVSGHKSYSTGIDDTLAVYTNSGDMHYTQDYYVSSTTNDAICAGDFDNDGFMDIASASWNNSIGIYFNSGHGGFSDYTRISSTRGASILKCVDIEGDGDSDLFYMSHNPNFGNYFGFYRNSGSGFNNYLHTNEALTEDYLSLNDIDNDGVIDVINGGRIYLNRGDHFEILSVPFGFTTAPAASSGDYDADGDIDLICLAPTEPMSISIMENLGNNVFESHPDQGYAPGDSYWCSPMLVRDLNGDGFADITYMNMVSAPILTDMNLHILINQDGTGFSSQTIHFDRMETIFWFNMLEVADLNADGAPDILISSVSPNDTSSYLFYMLFVIQNANGIFGQWVENDDPVITSEVSACAISAFPSPLNIGSGRLLILRVTDPQDRIIPGEKSIHIYNIRGQLIKTLGTDTLQNTTWDCLDNEGKSPKPGVYLIQYRINGITKSTTKVVLY